MQSMNQSWHYYLLHILQCFFNTLLLLSFIGFGFTWCLYVFIMLRGCLPCTVQCSHSTDGLHCMFRCVKYLHHVTNWHGAVLHQEMLKHNVDVRHAEGVEHHEHMDLIWAHNASETIFPKIARLINESYF